MRASDAQPIAKIKRIYASPGDTHAEDVVEFEVRPKGYTLRPHGVGDDDQLLERIQLWDLPQPGAARQLVRSWRLAYDVDQPGQWSLLRSVTVGGSAGEVLPALSEWRGRDG